MSFGDQRTRWHAYWGTLYMDGSALCGGCFGIRSGIWIGRRAVGIKMKLLNAVDDTEGCSQHCVFSLDDWLWYVFIFKRIRVLTLTLLHSHSRFILLLCLIRFVFGPASSWVIDVEDRRTRWPWPDIYCREYNAHQIMLFYWFFCYFTTLFWCARCRVSSGRTFMNYD
jgi:hypothetical protein